MQVAVKVVPPAGAPGTLPNLLDKLEQEAGEKPQSAEAVASQVKVDLLASLEAKVFDWIARGREANRTTTAHLPNVTFSSSFSR